MNNNDKKYKYTKQLLKIAIEAGQYRNQDIALKAGLSNKSVAQVSGWRNGRKKATERQMAYFIKEYEHLLKRKLEYLFYQIKVSRDGGELESNYIKLSGDVLYKYQIRLGAPHFSKETTSVMRLVILESEGGYKLIIQYRAGLIIWSKELDNYIPSLANGREGLVHGSNEESNWYVFEVLDCQDLDALISEFNKFKKNLLDGNNILDLAKFKGRANPNVKSVLFEIKQTAPMEYAFFHKFMNLGLHSELMPF